MKLGILKHFLKNWVRNMNFAVWFLLQTKIAKIISVKINLQDCLINF